MNRALIVLAALAAFLGGCEPRPNKPPEPPRPQPYTPAPLYARPDCGRTDLHRVHRMICDNESLDWLDRVLQKQWKAERQAATLEELKALDTLQHGFLRERRACQDDRCVADTYRRYIAPEPTPTPTAKPKPRPTARPKARPTATPRWRPRGPSCAATIGAEAARRLARQCDRVNPGRACSTDRSCAGLRRAIRDGCNATYRKPDFCVGL